MRELKCNNIRIESSGKLVRLFIDDIEIKHIRSISFNGTVGELPELDVKMIFFGGDNTQCETS